MQGPYLLPSPSPVITTDIEHLHAIVVWIPDPQLRALNPGETYGTRAMFESLDGFRPEEWGLPGYGEGEDQ